MAGIGFELKKLFHRKGLVAMVRAYGYAGVICTGPMLLGILLQFGVLAVSGWWHVPRADQNLLVCMISVHAARLIGVDQLPVHAGDAFPCGHAVRTS